MAGTGEKVSMTIEAIADLCQKKLEQGLTCYEDGQLSTAAHEWEDVLTIAKQVPHPAAAQAQATAMLLLPALYLDLQRYADGQQMAEAARALPHHAEPAIQRKINATLLANKTKELLQHFNATHAGMTREQALQNPAVLRQLQRVQQVDSHIRSMQQAADEARAAGDAGSLSVLLVALGTLLNQVNGEANQAKACLAEARQLQLSGKQLDLQQEAFLLTQLGVACKQDGDLPAAVANLQEAEQRQIALQRTRQGQAAVTIAELQQETYLQLQDSLMLLEQPKAALLAAERSRSLALQRFLEEAAGRGSARGFGSPAGDIHWPEISQAVASSGASLAVSYTVVDPETLLIWALDATGTIQHAERINLRGIVGGGCRFSSLDELVRVLLRDMEMLAPNTVRAAQQPGAALAGAAAADAAGTSAEPPATAAGAAVAAAAASAATEAAAAASVAAAAAAAAAAASGSEAASAPGDQHVDAAEAAAAEAVQELAEPWATALDALQTLADILLRPVQHQLADLPDDATVLFIPHSALHSVPWAALPLPGASAEASVQLVERFAPATAPSLRVARHCGERYQELFAASSGELDAARCCIVGNPLIAGDYDGKPPEPLTSAEKEALDIGVLLFGKLAARGNVLTAARATTAGVTDKMAQALLVHIAAHCIVDKNHPHGAVLLASPSGQTGPSILTADAIADKWGSKEAAPLSALMTVLSACNSGTGELVGEGLLGLPRALIQAGCATSVVSSWAVNDAAAAQLMAAFYDNLLRGWTVARALRFAMLGACTGTDGLPTSPALWANFQIVGCPAVCLCKGVKEEDEDDQAAGMLRTVRQRLSVANIFQRAFKGTDGYFNVINELASDPLSMRSLHVDKFTNVTDRAGRLGGGMAGEFAAEGSRHAEYGYTFTGPNSQMVEPGKAMKVWAGKHVAKITIGVWREQQQHFKLYCNTLERRAGQDFSISATSAFLPTETMTAAEWADHMVTSQQAPQAAAVQAEVAAPQLQP